MNPSKAFITTICNITKASERSPKKKEITDAPINISTRAFLNWDRRIVKAECFPFFVISLLLLSSYLIAASDSERPFVEVLYFAYSSSSDSIQGCILLFVSGFTFTSNLMQDTNLNGCLYPTAILNQI